jgi:hypothetical protein
MTFGSSASEIDWQQFSIQPEDLEFLSSYLLELETPLGPNELATQLISYRLRSDRESLEQQRAQSGKAYLPKDKYGINDRIAFPALNWKSGSVTNVRPGKTLNGGSFEVIDVQFADGTSGQFAAGLAEHSLNNPPEEQGAIEDEFTKAIAEHAKVLAPKITAALQENPDFVYIAGRWFPRTLIVDVNEGQLNVAEALLDMASGGPLPTHELLGEVELPAGLNPKLADFSLDLALQNDPRFDEVGASGEVAWFLHRVEPQAVRETPLFLRHSPVDIDRGALSEDMLDLERRLDDELSPADAQEDVELKEIQIPLLFPHWRVGSLPLTRKMARLFPSAYESPRVRFHFVDATSGERFQGWVVRSEKYVYGLREWYLKQGLMPGSYVRIRRGQPGEVMVSVEAHRSSKEWVRTALVGADGGLVFATLKQQVDSSFDERMMIYLPGEIAALEESWKKRDGKAAHLESIVSNTLRELAKLSSQNHVHASELYAAVNLSVRVPPAAVFAVLASGAQFQHVGHLHFRPVDEDFA